jgi:hypothetical protein
VQQEVAKLAQSAVEFPPMQKGASFKLEAVKTEIEQASSRAPESDDVVKAQIEAAR